MKSNLKNRALNLSYFTIVYNILEGLLSILVGILANNISLIGFGLDSAVESLSATVIVWRFRRYGVTSEEEETEVEKRALKYIAYTFFILGVYVLYESIDKIITNNISESSFLGILIAIASIIVMPTLFYMKYQTGKLLGSKAVIADSKETLTCALLSVALLIGLILNSVFGIWQADPVIGILIALFLLREGYEILTEE